MTIQDTEARQRQRYEDRLIPNKENKQLSAKGQWTVMTMTLIKCLTLLKQHNYFTQYYI
jgi:hypothetical protein